MEAHAQFCWSGDHTLEAAKLAVDFLSEVEADESFLILLSDANLERYGIPPPALARILTNNPSVNASVVLIGSLGEQADR